MTSLTAPNVLESSFPSVALPALNPSLAKVVLATPSSLLLRNWLGITNVSFARAVKSPWWAKVLFKMRATSFALSVPEKKCWRKWKPKTKNSYFRRHSPNSHFLNTIKFRFVNSRHFLTHYSAQKSFRKKIFGARFVHTQITNLILVK